MSTVNDASKLPNHINFYFNRINPLIFLQNLIIQYNYSRKIKISKEKILSLLLKKTNF